MMPEDNASAMHWVAGVLLVLLLLLVTLNHHLPFLNLPVGPVAFCLMLISGLYLNAQNPNDE